MEQPRIEGFLEYSCGDTAGRISFGTDSAESGPDISLRTSLAAEGSGLVFKLEIETKKEIVLRDLYFNADLIGSRDDLVYLNGYQSWTDTKEFSRRDRMRPPSKLFRPLTEKHRVTRYADYEFQPYSHRKGELHGASYGYIRENPNRVRFFGSLDERTGFTFFHVSLNKKTMTVRKDCAGLHVKGTTEPFNILFSEGSLDGVMDGWFADMGITARPALPRTGWTSWYNHYQNISETVVLENLEAFRDARIPIDIFQIDDGYQTAVGDWLSVRDCFPNGMQHIAERIRAAGFTPGIWLAPFAGEQTSALFRDHRDWFIADADGTPFHTGGNWSGFYSLDLYNDGVRDYIKRVFDVVVNEWGFSVLKLDFLYGVCIKPRADKTRGQIMCEAMDFLRDCAGDAQIIGCGVPLWPAFGKVEYCRIGTDIDLQWHNSFYSRIIHREFPSTKYALQNSIFRRHLDGRAFINDPDVFLLRHTNISLSEAQRKTVLYVNNVFGNLLFTSDDIRDYTEAERKLYRSSFPLVPKKIHEVEFDDNLYTVRFSAGNLDYLLVSNQGPDTRRTRLPDRLLFRAGSDRGWTAPSAEITVPPFTTECYLHCTPDIPWSAAGSTASAFPGSEIRRLSFKKDEIELDLLDPIPADGVFYVCVPKDAAVVRYAGTELPVQRISFGSIELRYAELVLNHA